MSMIPRIRVAMIWTFVMVTLMTVNAVVQSRLPTCPESGLLAYYNNCYGIFTFADGTKYVGEFKDDKANGQGTYTSEDGTKYVGEYKDDKKNGQGTEYLANGQVRRSGYWRDDQFVGSITSTAQSSPPPAPPRPVNSQTAATPITGKRVALVVGMSRYQNVSPLNNARNDAELMADALTKAGFTLVGGKAQIDLDLPAFNRAIRSLGDQSTGAAIALFYYAGHGLEVSGTNWLAPITSNPQKQADLPYEMVDASAVLQQFEAAGTKLNVMILDACRTNPFGGRGLLRSTNGGLATMQAPEGTIIAYATQPGRVAEDGDGRDSPFTTALVQTLRKPNLDILKFFNEVGLQVKRDTANRQQPWINASPIEGDFYFTN